MKHLFPILFLAFAFLIALHQYIYWGKWFEFSDIHHETFIFGFIFAGLVLFLMRGKRS